MRVAALTFMSLPAFVHVPEKIMLKIWANEYVDFFTLLPNKSVSQAHSFALTLSEGEEELG